MIIILPVDPWPVDTPNKLGCACICAQQVKSVPERFGLYQFLPEFQNLRGVSQ
jgi:hypothetical protein